VYAATCPACLHQEGPKIGFITSKDKTGHGILGGRNSRREENASRLLFIAQDYILFYQYFHGDEGAGLGASHQTG
jgi:hypothetical protein